MSSGKDAKKLMDRQKKQDSPHHFDWMFVAAADLRWVLIPKTIVSKQLQGLLGSFTAEITHQRDYAGKLSWKWRILVIRMHDSLNKSPSRRYSGDGM